MSLRTFARRRPFVAFVAAVAAAGLAGFVWTSQSNALPACPTVLGNFEIDGDMTQATCTPSLDDWNTPGLGVASSTQGGTYKTAGKDHDDPSGWSSTGSTPDKTNFEQVYGFSRVVNGKFFAYVAWERTDTAGTQGYAIEIDNSPPNVGSDGSPQPDRSNGGVVVYISSVGSSPPAFDSACAFTSQATYGTTCTNSNANIIAAINTASISDPLRGTTQAAGSFFEVAINVSDLTGIVPSCPGSTAASGYIRSVTGQVSNGNLKGYMAPLTLQPDSTCVPPPIDTTANPGGTLNARGTTQSDSAVVGTGAAPGVGTVDFFLCQPADVVVNQGCVTGGTKVGVTKTLDGTGSASSDSVTGATTPNDNADGKYCWRAEFTPSANDHNYLPGSHTNYGSECFTIVHGTPKIATQIAVTGANSPGLGFTTLGDAATLTGFVGSVTGQTIHFDLYGPYTGAIPSDCTSDTPAFSTTGLLDASGHATTSQTFDPTEAGTYVWVASYDASLDGLNDGVTGACDDSNESVTVVGAQIDVAKSANPVGPVSAGATIGFDITVSNAGDVPATGVHVHDALPAGADGVANGDLNWTLNPAYTNCAITGALHAQVLDCTFPDPIGKGSLTPIHIESSTTQADCGVVKNQASVSTTNGTGGDSDVATVTVQCANLTIDKTADADTVNAGEQIGFLVTATNNGAGAATGTLVDDPLPAGVGVEWFVDMSKTSGPLLCTIDGNPPTQELKCTGTLASGASQVIHLVSSTNGGSCGPYSNTATVSATFVTGKPESTASTTVQCPDLSVTKTADADEVSAGEPIGFTVTVSNGDQPGTGDATGVTINDPLPGGPGINWTIDQNPGNCSIDTDAQTQLQTLICTAIDLAAGESETVHVISATAFESCAHYVNTAHVSLTNGPLEQDLSGAVGLKPAAVGDPIIFSATASETVDCPTLAITKVADDKAVNTGDTIGFTIHATNAGPGTAFAAVIQDTLPAHPGVSWTISPDYPGPGVCSITGPDLHQVLTCELGDFPAGGDATVHIQTDTTADSCGDYDNTALLLSGNAPTVQGSATTRVNCAGAAPETPPPLAATGAGPVHGEFGWAFALILAGLVLTVSGRKVRPGRQH